VDVPDRAVPVRFALAATVLAGLWLGAARAPAARAQVFDCEDIDHDCAADGSVSKGIRKGGAALVQCARHGTNPCDLGPALSRIRDGQCRGAVECQLHALFDQVSDGTTTCVQELYRRGYEFMAKKVSRIQHQRRERIVDDLADCKARAGRRCVDPVTPPLADACAGRTTPAAGADCVCAVADSLSSRLLLHPPICVQQPAQPCAVQVGSAPRPNFVIILSDDQRWDMVDARHRSPNRRGPVMPIVTRELVDSGVTFPQGNVTTALCCPSRTSILTGKYAHNTGIRDNAPPDGGAEVFDDHCTVATWLKAAGYRTGFVGKYLNGYESLSPCIPPGYDDWHVQVQVKFYDYDLNDNGVLTHFASAPSDYSGDVMTQRAVDFIHASIGERFFLHLSQKAPHAPATPAPRHIGLFAGLAPFRPPNYDEADVSDKPAWVQALRFKDGSTDEFRIDQLESLQAVDEGVGAIMQALRDIGADHDTLVIYTSDNGYAWGAHRWRAKQCPYEECMRVPMIMRYPDLAGTTPRSDDRIVLNVDFAATIADLAGITPPELVNGMSVAPLLSDTAVSWRTDMLNEHWNGKIPTNALVKGEFDGASWKYVEYLTGETELYNLDLDPFELTNVTNDPAHVALKATLAARLHQLQAQ
jgi:N-acetylglucosamine-6-sulfatase